MSGPTPIILCVKSYTMATEAMGSLQPEYEVIHVISSAAAGACDIPGLLRGEAPSPSDPNNLGTQNYSKTAVAVVTGRMYDDVSFAEMREACKGRSNVPWLRQDFSKPEPPLGQGFAEAIMERVKVCLRDLTVKGRLKQDGVYLY